MNPSEVEPMKHVKLHHLRNVLGFSALITLSFCGAPAKAQSTSAQSNTTATTSSNTNQTPQDNPVLRREVTQFDQFMDSHREISEQVTKNPNLLDNQQFLQTHPALQTFIQNHPEIHQAVKQSPSAFMSQMHSYEQTENRGDNDKDRQMDRERFDKFLDSHREIAEQVRKNPSLVNDDKFDKDHPELQAYLRQNPDIRDEARNNPSAFMRQDDRSDDRDRQYTDRDKDHDFDRDKSTRFREFLGGHSDIAEQLSRNPSLCKDREFMQAHPELQSYLKDNPDVNQELMNNPQGFMKSAQPTSSTTGAATSGTKSPTYDPNKATH
jgi:hypothetical protein